ncbi:MAG: aminotransferase class I/II-fold pyridoxal phosphate-dependent enzyme [Bacteroidota bacterium]
MKIQSQSPETLCVHAGTFFSEEDGGINSPIFPSTAFRYDQNAAVPYARYLNVPNQEAVTQKVAALEGTETALVLSSGMAAISGAIMGLVKQGEHIVFQDSLYGGTQYFITEILDQFGVAYTLVNQHNVEGFHAAIQENTKLIYIETPSNPLLEIIDIEAIVTLAKEHGILSMIDNTFTSPINQQPAHWGIDVVIHSATKYLGGHSDLMAGIIASREELIQKIKPVAINFGACLDARVCYLLERSLKTLALRIKQHNQNAMEVAEFLMAHPKVEAVYYPGLATHPNHALAKKQMNGFGGMLSFEIQGEYEDVHHFFGRLQMIDRAVSLGGVETITCSPRETSHGKISPEARQKLGIRDTLIRLSVGIEDAKDIIADLERALT